MAKVKLTAWESDVSATVRSLMPGIAVRSLEEPRVIHALRRIGNHLGEAELGHRSVYHWSSPSFTKYPGDNPEEVERLEVAEFAGALLAFATPDDDDGKHEPSFLVLSDPQPWMHEQPHNVRVLRETLWKIREAGASKTVILVGEDFDLPAEVAADFWCTDFDLPNAGFFRELFDKNIEQFKLVPELKDVSFDANAVDSFSHACAGLSEYAGRSLFAKAIATYEALDIRAVKLAHREKEQIVRRSGVGEIEQPTPGGLARVGGLDCFKDYVLEISALLKEQDAARAFGCTLPSGIMLMGVPGTGKTLVARALGSHLNLPILKLDMGAMFGSLVGESEARFRKFRQTAEAIGSCIVFADEFEKGIGGGDGERDGGTTSRVKQALLSWLNDKPDSILFVGTVNSIEAFNQNPEMLRSGRFDSVWFVDLPDARSRCEIFAIHINKTGHPLPDAESLKQLAKLTAGYSGAEIENIVQTATRRAFTLKLKAPTFPQYVAAVQDVVPLSVTMHDRLVDLRQYVKDGKARAAGALLDGDAKTQAKADAQALNGLSIPQLLK